MGSQNQPESNGALVNPDGAKDWKHALGAVALLHYMLFGIVGTLSIARCDQKFAGRR